jgi:FlaG/FlaF family flagellin (archaellin)
MGFKSTGNRGVTGTLKRHLRRNKKGMSIVISTIIIVAISITMAIAVSFWAMGIGDAMQKFEKLEFVSAYAGDTPVYYAGRQCFVIYLNVKNTGTNTATINNVFLDNKPYNAQNNRTPGGILAYQNGVIAISLQTGQSLGGQLYLPVGGLWNSGDYVDIEIETTAGRHYPYTVMLP